MVQEVLLSLYMGILLLLGGAVCGGPLIAVLNEFRAWRWKTPFTDKFAQQISRMSIMSFFALVLLLAAAYIVVFLLGIPAWDDLLLRMEPGHMLPLMLWAGGVFLLIVYYSTWKRWTRQKFRHWLLGLVSLLVIWLGTFGTINFLLRQFLFPLQLDCTWTCLLLDVGNILFWPVLAQFVLVSLGGSGVFSTNYLLLRREKDDFGRDYYRFCMYRACKWAFVFAAQLVFLFGVAYLAARDDLQFLFNYCMLVPLLSGVVLILIPGLAWSRVLLSENPLRNKVSIVLALLCSWLAMGSMFLYYFRVFSAV